MKPLGPALLLLGSLSACLPPGEDGAPDPTTGAGVPQRTPLDPDIVRGIYRVELTYENEDCAPGDVELRSTVRARVDRSVDAIEIEYPHLLPDDALGFETRRRLVLGAGPWINEEDFFTFCPATSDQSLLGGLRLAATQPDDEGFEFEAQETYDPRCEPAPMPAQGCNWSATGRYVLEEACPRACRITRKAFDPTGWSLQCECA